jgi:hypothetical protein
VPGERGVTVALTRALFAWSPHDNSWPIPHFEMDAPENFATILAVNAANLPG